jgi:hypothetical protein
MNSSSNYCTQEREDSSECAPLFEAHLSTPCIRVKTIREAMLYFPCPLLMVADKAVGGLRV